MESSKGILSATDELLLIAVRGSQARCDKAARLLAEREIDWESLSRDSARNRVDASVAELLAHPLIQPVVPARRASYWRAQGMRAGFRAELAQRRVQELGSALQTAGIRMLVYKGLDFQLRYYSKACPRGFSDIDIVVSPENAEEAAECLETRGYLPLDRNKPLAYYRRFHLHATYRRPGQPWPVELHWALDSPFSARPDPTARVLDAAEPDPQLGVNVLRPHPIDALALMCMHLDKHLGRTAWLPDPTSRLLAIALEGGLIWVLDIVRWMQRSASVHSTDRVLERIRQLGAERSFVVAVRLAVDLRRDAVPDWAAQHADRMPRHTPLIVRLLFPDLARGRGVQPAGQTRRRRLLTVWRAGGFRPIRVLEFVLPAGRIPRSRAARIGTPRGGAPESAAGIGGTRRAALGIANLWALWRTAPLQRRRRGVARHWISSRRRIGRARDTAS